MAIGVEAVRSMDLRGKGGVKARRVRQGRSAEMPLGQITCPELVEWAGVAARLAAYFVRRLF